MWTVNLTLFLAIGISLVVWLLQESLGRRFRVQYLLEQAHKAAQQGLDAGFPLWLKILSVILVGSWLTLLVTVYQKRDGDFAVILVSLVLFSGFVTAVDRWVFRRRREALVGTTPVQQVLAKTRVDSERQGLVDWAEQDFILAEYAKSFFPVLLVVLVLRSFLMEPFKIPSASMVPTLEVNDFILVNKFAYGLRLPVAGTMLMPLAEPARGDVMVFFPPNDKRYFIKRVIGLPGDEIRLDNNVLYINGVRMQQEVIEMQSGWPPMMVGKEDLQGVSHLMQRYTVPTVHSQYQAKVPAGHYFMMGDNRDNSSDSRFWGMVPETNIVGKAVYIWMHWGSWLSLPSFSRNGVIN
jgi:signal peptidase I